MLRLLVLSALSVYTAAAQAQVYKCIDASGKTTYLQSFCPSGAKSAAISRIVPPAPPPPAAGEGGAEEEGKAGKDGKVAKASGPKSAAELEQEFRKRKQEQEKLQEKEAQKLANAKIREENCRSSRLQLMNLESGARQLRLDDKGERSYLNDTQIEQEKANARKAVELWCN